MKAPSDAFAGAEGVFHQHVADYLQTAFRGVREVWWTTFPLGGGGRIRGAQLKRRGTKKGTSDVLIVWKGIAHFIELKVKGGVVSDDQIDTAIDITDAGGKCGVAWNLAEVEAHITRWGLPARARLFA